MLAKVIPNSSQALFGKPLGCPLVEFSLQAAREELTANCIAPGESDGEKIKAEVEFLNERRTNFLCYTYMRQWNPALKHTEQGQSPYP